MEHPTEVTVAGDLFNRPNADIILRTSDGGMAKVPQPSGGSERAVVPVEEDSTTLDALLRFMYPCDDPTFDDVMRLGDVLRAAVKYQADLIAQRLKRQLSMFDDPLRVFTVACLADLESEAYQAAVEWCQDKAYDLENTYVKEMDVLSAGIYHRLLCFCDKYKRGHELPEQYSFTRPVGTSASPAEPSQPFTVPSPFDRPSAHANIVVRSGDKVDFYVNEVILTMGSNMLASDLHDARDNGPKSRDGYRILALPERAEVLLPILQLTYPGLSPHIREWRLLTAILETAHKYEFVRATDLTKSAWVKEIENAPLRSYFIAVQRGWQTEAKLAAKHAVLYPVDQYYPEMEFVSASYYDRFLRYRQQCRRSVIDARRAFMDDVYLASSLNQTEVYDVFFHEHDVSTMFHYSLHATWARAGASTPGLRPSRWAMTIPLPQKTFGLGGEWPMHIQQLMTCLNTWNGRHGDVMELMHNYDKYGGEAMDAVDQLVLEV
ncbi:hypothetical protein DAEQUDRAFT_572087 [Daedalea quercina L-15889]|uniref:BTB domain-containing protein n=1 Tax=Daedalea quercina L-15889 TaxID=1314783 RepID=A0A165LV28_9APHY|nr:hypothetical protein DAEQUDRAFT_572087 [Daedalea quercina L-15889]